MEKILKIIWYKIYNWFKLWYYRIWYRNRIFYLCTRVAYKPLDILKISRDIEIICLYKSKNLHTPIDEDSFMVKDYKTKFICLN